jgi:hypothetical protein
LLLSQLYTEYIIVVRAKYSSNTYLTVSVTKREEFRH